MKTTPFTCPRCRTNSPFIVEAIDSHMTDGRTGYMLQAFRCNKCNVEWCEKFNYQYAGYQDWDKETFKYGKKYDADGEEIQ